MVKPNKARNTEKQTTTEETSDETNANQLAASSVQDAATDETPTMTDVMTAINRLNQNVDSKFELLNASIASLKRSLDTVEQRVLSNEGGLTEHEARIKKLEDHCSKWAEEASSLSERVDDLVSRSRRQNIWIIGVKEGMEKLSAPLVNLSQGFITTQ